MRSPIPRHDQKPPPSQPVFQQLKNDWERVALASALVYALGYVARAIHAWDYNFGALPGARFDYLMAGVFLAVPVVIVAATLFGGYKGVLWLRAWAVANPGRAKRWSSRVVTPVLFGSVGLMIFRDQLWFLSEAERTSLGPIATAAFFLSIVFGAILTPDKAGTDRSIEPVQAITTERKVDLLAWLGWTLNFMGRAFSDLVVAYFGLICFLLFFVAAFFGAGLLSKWPQEFGGVKPKCAVLDIAVDQLSPELAQLLMPPLSPTSREQKIVRSHQLEVYSTSGPWLIRAPEPSASASAPSRRSIRLPDQAVRLVEWVARATPLPQGSHACSATA